MVRRLLAQPFSVRSDVRDIAAPRASATSCCRLFKHVRRRVVLRARGTNPRLSGGESTPLGRMVALSRAGPPPGTLGMGATPLESTSPVVCGCFAGASQSAGWGAHAHVHEGVGLEGNTPRLSSQGAALGLVAPAVEDLGSDDRQLPALAVPGLRVTKLIVTAVITREAFIP